VSGSKNEAPSEAIAASAPGSLAAGGRPPGFDASRCKQRNTLERCLSKLKGHRAVATRYDKRDYIYRGTIDVASIRIWLRDPVT
jgi:transposase